MIGSILSALSGKTRMTACVFGEHGVTACQGSGSGRCDLVISNRSFDPVIESCEPWNASVRDWISETISADARIATSIPLSHCRWWHAAADTKAAEQAGEAASELARAFGLSQDDLLLECIPSDDCGSGPSLWIGCKRHTVDGLVSGFSSLRMRPVRIDITEMAIARVVHKVLNHSRLDAGFILCVPSHQGTSLLVVSSQGRIMGARWMPFADAPAITAEQWAESTAFEIGILKLYHAKSDGESGDISLVCVHETETRPWCRSESLERMINMPCMPVGAIASRIATSIGGGDGVDAAMLLACIGLLDHDPLTNIHAESACSSRHQSPIRSMS